MLGIRKTLAYNGESQSDREVVVERELGDVGTDFVFENDHVKVWQLVLEPGQASSCHGRQGLDTPRHKSGKRPLQQLDNRVETVAGRGQHHSLKEVSFA